MMKFGGIGGSIFVACLLWACKTREPVAPPPDARRPHRTIERAPGVVYALPPHAIADDRIGPYKLGESLTATLQALPFGPRMTVLDVGGLVRWSIIRAEDDKLWIGGEPTGTVAFVSVFSPQVARIASGLTIGVGEDELTAELGPPLRFANGAADPRLRRFPSLPSTRFFIENGRLRAVILIGDDLARVAPPDQACDGVLAALKFASSMRGDGLCRNGAWVTALGDDLVSVTVDENGKVKRMVLAKVPGLKFVGALDNGDMLATVVQRAVDDRKFWLVTQWMWQAQKLVRIADEPSYVISREAADALGAKFESIDIAHELFVTQSGVHIAGILEMQIGTGLVAIPTRTVLIPLHSREASADPLHGVHAPRAGSAGNGTMAVPESAPSPRPGQPVPASGSVERAHDKPGM